jgi:hypothetical protein
MPIGRIRNINRQKQIVKNTTPVNNTTKNVVDKTGTSIDTTSIDTTSIDTTSIDTVSEIPIKKEIIEPDNSVKEPVVEKKSINIVLI